LDFSKREALLKSIRRKDIVGAVVTGGNARLGGFGKRSREKNHKDGGDKEMSLFAAKAKPADSLARRCVTKCSGNRGTPSRDKFNE